MDNMYDDEQNEDILDPLAGLRERRKNAQMARDVTGASSQMLETISGAKAAPADFGASGLQSELQQRLRAKLADESAAKQAPTASQSEKFTGLHVRKGQHKDKPIYYMPGKGMFVRDGDKIITETEQSETFRNPYKRMVEKPEFQKTLDLRKIGLQEYSAKRASDAQIKGMSDTRELFKTIGRIRELKPSVNTGPIISKKEDVQGVFSDKTPEYARLEGITGKSLAEFLKSISGAAISEKEAERLSKVVPHTGMNDDEFMIKLDEFEKGLRRGIKQFIDTNVAAGKDMSAIKEQMISDGLYDESSKAVSKPKKESTKPQQKPKRSAAEIRAELEAIKAKRAKLGE